jgi:hypothetical protein
LQGTICDIFENLRLEQVFQIFPDAAAALAATWLFGAFTGFIASLFVEPELRQDETAHERVLQEIRTLDSKLSSLEAKLDELKNVSVKFWSSLKYWEIIADRLSKAGWSLGWISAIDSEGRTIGIADAHRDNGKRFIVTADGKLSAFVELERQVLTVTFYLESIRAGGQWR